MAKPSKPDKKSDAKRTKEKAAESGVSAAQRVFGKVLEKVDPKTKG
jgi:hypothetical protein